MVGPSGAEGSFMSEHFMSETGKGSTSRRSPQAIGSLPLLLIPSTRATGEVYVPTSPLIQVLAYCPTRGTPFIWALGSTRNFHRFERSSRRTREESILFGNRT